MFAKPWSLHLIPALTFVVVGTASARRVARSTQLQLASARPTPRIHSLRPAPHPASACFDPPSTLRSTPSWCCTHTQCHAEAQLRVSHVALRAGTLLGVPRTSPRMYASSSSSSSLQPPSVLSVRTASRGQYRADVREHWRCEYLSLPDEAVRLSVSHLALSEALSAVSDGLSSRDTTRQHEPVLMPPPLPPPPPLPVLAVSRGQ